MVRKKTQTKAEPHDDFWKRLAGFSSVFASIRDAVVFINAKGNIMTANPAIELLTGRAPADFGGLPAASALAFSCATEDAANVLREAMEGWRAVEFPDACVLRHANGNEISVAASATPLYYEDGQYAGIILVIRDASRDMDLKNQQYAFFSFATHQMRQPLAYLRLGIEGILTRRDALDPNHREILEELLQTVLKSAKFVKELLDVARLEQGRIDLVAGDVDMRKLLEEVCRELIHFAEGNNIALRIFLQSDSGTPSVIRADAERLKDVFRNLITNAISYNRPKGEVRVDIFGVSAGKAAENAASLHGSEDMQSYFRSFVSGEKPEGAPFLVVTVRDTGMGIPEKDQPFIFRSFFRAGNVQKRGIQGTGLGLSIVKSIVERSGGRVGFESKEGEGTTFYVFFPCIV